MIDNLTHYSLGLSVNNAESIEKRANELELPYIGIADHGSLAGSVEFLNQFKKSKIKPIIGLTCRIRGHIVKVYPKNLDQYYQLVTAYSNSSWLDDLPTLSLNELNGLNFVLNPRSFNLFASVETTTITDAQSALVSDYNSVINNTIALFQEYGNVYFGRKNSFLCTDQLVNDIISQHPITEIASSEAAYETTNRKTDYEVVLANKLKTSIANLPIPDDLHIKSMSDFDPQIVENTHKFVESIEKYNLNRKPTLPEFKCGKSEKEYLLELAREGYLFRKRDSWNREIYGNRVKHELSVIEKASLEGYFLIVQDFVRWAKNNNILVGPSRGSCGGSLVAYLLQITEVDPIPNGLIFERFYNEGRNSEDNIEYPDIDIDFPKSRREDVIHYVEDKYGLDHVAQVATYGRMMGAGSLKDVFRAHQACSFHEANQITKDFPSEAKIEEFLLKQDTHSVIQWILENEPEQVSEYCKLNDDGTLSGNMADYFSSAIRLEGTLKTQGKHAAGLIISKEVLGKVCPLIPDKNGDRKLVGYDMDSAKKAGLLKFDFLSLSTLDRLQMVNDLLKEQGIT